MTTLNALTKKINALTKKLATANIHFNYLVTIKESKGSIVKALMKVYTLEILLEKEELKLAKEQAKEQAEEQAKEQTIKEEVKEVKEEVKEVKKEVKEVKKEVKEVKKEEEEEKYIEWINGQENHSSYYGKFYVKGLTGVKEDHSCNRYDRHHGYQYWVKNLTKENKELFSIFIQEGNKTEGCTRFEFYICQVDISTENYLEGHDRNDGFISGNFKIIACAKEKSKGSRLMSWWVDQPLLQSLEYAQKCAIALEKKGCEFP